MAMKILLANPRGFCAGVNMAIDCVDRVLKLKGPPIYVYHESYITSTCGTISSSREWSLQFH